jgi:drug/metabolite transporter (DMT)-like permease
MLELRRRAAAPGMKLSARLALLMTLPPLLWAGNAVVGRLMAGQVPPLTLNFLRWLLAVLFLLPLAWRALRPWSRIRQRWLYLAAIGLLGVGLFNSLQYLAVLSSSPLNVTLVASSMPVWMLAVGALFYGEHPTRRQLAGAALGFAGVCVVLGRGSLHTLLNVHFVAGDVYILLAVIGWAFYSWLLARPPAHMRGDQRPDWDWAALLLVQALFGLGASALFTAGEQLAGAAPIRWSPGVVAALLYVSLGASIVAYRCWGLGVAAGGPTLAAIFNNLTPLFTAVLSALLLGETPQPYHAVAFALIVGGIAVSALRPLQKVPG